jgi:hypothetical protein
MAQVMHQLGDLATSGVESLLARRRGEPPPGTMERPGGDEPSGTSGTEPTVAGAIAGVVS